MGAARLSFVFGASLQGDRLIVLLCDFQDKGLEPQLILCILPAKEKGLYDEIKTVAMCVFVP